MVSNDTDATLSNRQRKIRERQRATVNTNQFPNQTAFRQAERRFRHGGGFIPKDKSTWTGVVDFSCIDEHDALLNAQIIELELQWDPRMAELTSWTNTDLCSTTTSTTNGWSGKDVFSPPRAYTLASAPGLIVLPELLTPAAQRYIAYQCLNTYACSPNRNNLDAHYILPDCGVWQLALQDTTNAFATDPNTSTLSSEQHEPAGYYEDDSYAPTNESTNELATKKTRTTELPPASVLLRKLRWTTLGYQYDWSNKQYHPEHRHPFPNDLAELTRSIVRCINGIRRKSATSIDNATLSLFNYDYEQYQPEAGVVNFYQIRNTLTAHVDKSEENMEAPLVSFSIGHACIYLLGGEDRTQPPTPIYLRSGDVLIMTGTSRYAYHGVPRIVEDTLPDWLAANPCDSHTGTHYEQKSSQEEEQVKDSIDMSNTDYWSRYGAYLSTSRINVNVRQVMFNNANINSNSNNINGNNK
ncbi:hypothetical protein BDF19DRAFT_425481 [Syncephalis fuscata]|nr:hypothetical protein BDF19DRAFT_425481 [Syncephalis fuscata]